MRRPAAVGGAPAFPEGVPFARPLTPPFERVAARLAPSYDRGMLTNGPLVRELEERLADRLGVPEVVALSSCTAGLMLTIQALAPAGPVVLPSFTFSASAHAVAWNGLAPVFCECDPTSCQIDVDDARGRLDGAGAILATHVFGAPAPVDEVTALAASAGIPVVFDAAHALGATHDGVACGGFGAAEVFSLSPTKLVVAGEGGIVATRDADLARHLRLGRDYGNPGDYDTQFVGLNARMSEIHAAIALESLDQLDGHLAQRRALADRYVTGLAGVPGLAVQAVADGDESTWKDLTIVIDVETFGLPREQLVDALTAEGIDTRRYFYPAVHRQRAYAGVEGGPLPVTDDVADRVLSLPMFATLREDQVDGIVEVLASLAHHAEEVRAA